MKKILGAALGALLATGSANAALLNFTVTGDYSASWQIDSAPIPSYAANGFSFGLNGLPFSNTSSGIANFRFFTSAVFGGLQITDPANNNSLLFAADGPVLYSGPETAPMFRPGTFSLTGSNSRNYTLTIAAPSVPEPATWAMFIGGFGLIGGAMRRRQRVNVRFS